MVKQQVTLLCAGEGMDGGRAEDFPSAAGLSMPVGPFASALPGAGGVSHHDLSKNLCSGIFESVPARGGKWEEAQLPAHCEVSQMLLLPLPTRQTSRNLELAPHKSHPATPELLQAHQLWGCAWAAHQGPRMALTSQGLSNSTATLNKGGSAGW